MACRWCKSALAGGGRSALLLALLVNLALAEFDIDDSLLYRVDFPGNKPESSKGEDSNTGDLFAEQSETYTMVDRNQEKFECRIPKVSTTDTDKLSDYTGLSPLGLIEQLFGAAPCAIRMESYWSYELCHGKFLRQFHEDRVGKEMKVQEYILGKFNKQKFEDDKKEEERDRKNDITRHPPTKKIESVNLPYFELVMEDGTMCDLNKQPRRARILYICYPTGRNEIYQLKETSTCEYEVIVLSSVLCTHPAFKHKEVDEHAISCRPLADNGRAKPRDLVELETEAAKLRSAKMWEAHMKAGDKPGQVKMEIRPVNSGSSTPLNSDEDVEMDIDKFKSETKELWREIKREPFKPLMDPQVVKQFLRGEYCLYGGSGWWKYEFCYGNKVDQYHQEDNGGKTVINLGNFDLDDHLQWLEDHPHKKPKPADGRKHVSHFYSDGQLCEITGKPRHIEVKMKCKRADSPSAVTLYLLEPRTCEYILVVESPLVCDILPHADPDTGLMPSGILDDLERKNAMLNRKFEEDELESFVDLTTEIDRDLEELENFFTPAERERLVNLKKRLETRRGDRDHSRQMELEQTKSQSTKSKSSKKTTEFESSVSSKSSSKSSTSSATNVNEFSSVVNGRETTVREKVTVVDGRKTIVKEILVDGRLVSSEVFGEDPVTGALVAIEGSLKPVKVSREEDEVEDMEPDRKSDAKSKDEL